MFLPCIVDPIAGHRLAARASPTCNVVGQAAGPTSNVVGPGHGSTFSDLTFPLRADDPVDPSLAERARPTSNVVGLGAGPASNVIGPCHGSTSNVVGPVASPEDSPGPTATAAGPGCSPTAALTSIGQANPLLSES